MRNRAVALLSGAVLLAVIGAGAASASASASAASGITIKVIQSAPEVQLIDLGNPGPTPGDISIFKSDLFAENGTTNVGALHITCSLNFDQVNVCVGIFSFTKRGQISVDAAPVFPNPTVGMVTGGTGQFRDVRGQVDIQPQPDGTTQLTFRLTP